MDPRLDQSHDIAAGLRMARGFLRDVLNLGLPTATELLDPITPQYIADLVCWSAIGARTAEQLDDNLGALEVQLAPEQAKALEEVSRPKLNFPFDFVQNSSGFGHSGAIVNGVEAPVNPLSPKNDSERY